MQPIQPVLTGLEVDLGRDAIDGPHLAAGRAGARLKGRRRYWSLRDLSRRLWLGRGYELLCQLVRSGILPASRSARSWWIDDADVLGLRTAFDDRAGKVRAFRQLDRWLRERCWAIPASAETRALRVLDEHVPPGASSARLAIFHWRGTAYLPRHAWRMDVAPHGGLVYRHRSGAALAGTGAAGAPAA